MTAPPPLEEREAQLGSASLAALKRVRKEGQVPAQEFNAGVVRKLLELRLCEYVEMPSPYPTGRRKTVSGLVPAAAEGPATD